MTKDKTDSKGKNPEEEYKWFASKELGKLYELYREYESNGLSANVLENKQPFLQTPVVMAKMEGVLRRGEEMLGDSDTVDSIFKEEFSKVMDRIRKKSLEKAMRDIARDKDDGFDTFLAKKD
jgi:hypothetical protein